MGDGRAEGSPATGDGGQAAISLTPDIDRTQVRIFESSQLEVSYVGDLLYSNAYPSQCRLCGLPPRAWQEGCADCKTLVSAASSDLVSTSPWTPPSFVLVPGWIPSPSVALRQTQGKLVQLGFVC